MIPHDQSFWTSLLQRRRQSWRRSLQRRMEEVRMRGLAGWKWLNSHALKHEHHAKRLYLHAIIFSSLDVHTLSLPPSIHHQCVIYTDAPLTLPPLKTPPPAALSLADAADSTSQRSKSTKVREVCANHQSDFQHCSGLTNRLNVIEKCIEIMLKF